MAKTSADIQRWALIGARARIQELSAEIEAIRRAFPGEFGLRVGRKKNAIWTGGGAGGAGIKQATRRKRTMSADARRRISEAQKARWAKQKAGKKR